MRPDPLAGRRPRRRDPGTGDSSDPVKDKDAVRYSELGYDEVLAKNLGVMDATAIALCRDQSMPVRVFNMNKKGALMRIIQGEDEGTLVS